jgi:hypothetical protein
MRSFDVFADHVGPIMSKDIGLFARATDENDDRETLLRTANRFLDLLGYPA